MIIEDGVIILRPGENDSTCEEPELEEEPTEPPQKRVELPDGTAAPEQNVQTLEDGTIMAYIGDEATDHRCFFSDGSYAYTDYSDVEGSICIYKEAASVHGRWL